MWKDLQQRFPGYRIVNRGFGGSTIADLLYYKQDIIDPYRAKQVVIYCGENDIGSGRRGAMDTMLTNLKSLVSHIRTQSPKAHIVYVGMKPSPRRRAILPMIQQANTEVEAYFKTLKRARFVPVYNDMLLTDGQPNPALFLADSLHMSSAGYDIWQQKLKPVLKR
jgi:lysophospholipase L1-like esterase